MEVIVNNKKLINENPKLMIEAYRLVIQEAGYYLGPIYLGL